MPGADFRTKIVEMDSLLRIRQDATRDRQTVVLCHGCFDIVHPGHIRYLHFARQQGDILIVSTTSDAAIDKGPLRPYIPQELRAENLAALECVDYVYVDPHPTAASLLAKVQPDIYIKGGEYETNQDPRFLRERATVEGYGGRIVFSSGQPVFSSSHIISRMTDEKSLAGARLAAICRRHEIGFSKLTSILDRFAGQRVVVIGDLMADTYVHCDAGGVATEAPMMSLNVMGEEHFLGGAGVVAAHLQALGAAPFLVSTVGRDEWSRWTASRLGELGIDSYLHPARQGLVHKIRYLADGQKLFKADYGSPSPLDSQSEKSVAGALLEAANDAAAVIWCDYGYGTITDSLMGHVEDPLRRRVKLIAADVSSRGKLLRFRNVDLLTPTERELRSAAGNSEMGLSHVAWHTLQQTQAKRLLVTLGKKGAVLFDRPNHDRGHPDWAGRLVSEYLPSLGDAAADPLGCGDSLLATMTLALAAGANIMQALYLGSAAAAVEVGCSGNVPVEAAALRQMLVSRAELFEAESLEGPLEVALPCPADGDANVIPAIQPRTLPALVK